MEKQVKHIVFSVINDLSFDQRMQRICSTLQKNGYNCTLIGRRLKSSTELPDRGFSQKRISCLVNKGPLFYLEYNIRLIFTLLFIRSDAVCSVDADTAASGLFVTRFTGRKFIFDAHELFSEVPEVQNRPWVQKIWRLVEKRAFRRARLSYTVGEALAAYFSESTSKPVEVIRNAPPMSSFVPPNPEAEAVILYQGALNKGRGLENLVRSMKDIEARLWLAGEGDLSNEIRSLVKLLNLNDKVRFWGMLLPEELRLLTGRAWVGYNISEADGLSYVLSLNNKFFDYIHAGLPSVINDFPEYRALNKKYEVGIITDSSVSAITTAINALINDKDLRTKLSSNCLKASKELNWENEGKKLVELYNQLFEK